MGYKNITSGTKVGKARAIRFILAGSGTLGLEVMFQFKESSTNSDETLNYVFWLSAAAIEYSMDTLVTVLGYSGDDRHDATGVLLDPKALDWSREVSLVVEEEHYEKDGQQKTAMKIKYVNALGGSAYSAASPQVVTSKLAEVNFRARFLAAKQQGGSQAAPTGQPAQRSLSF